MYYLQFDLEVDDYADISGLHLMRCYSVYRLEVSGIRSIKELFCWS